MVQVAQLTGHSVKKKLRVEWRESPSNLVMVKVPPTSTVALMVRNIPLGEVRGWMDGWKSTSSPTHLSLSLSLSLSRVVVVVVLTDWLTVDLTGCRPAKLRRRRGRTGKGRERERWSFVVLLLSIQLHFNFTLQDKDARGLSTGFHFLFLE